MKTNRKFNFSKKTQTILGIVGILAILAILFTLVMVIFPIVFAPKVAFMWEIISVLMLLSTGLAFISIFVLSQNVHLFSKPSN